MLAQHKTIQAHTDTRTYAHPRLHDLHDYMFVVRTCNHVTAHCIGVCFGFSMPLKRLCRPRAHACTQKLFVKQQSARRARLIARLGGTRWAQHRALLLRARDGRQPRPHATHQDALCRSAWERGPWFTYATCGPLVRNAACSSRRRVTCAGMLDVCRVPNTRL